MNIKLNIKKGFKEKQICDSWIRIDLDWGHILSKAKHSHCALCQTFMNYFNDLLISDVILCLSEFKSYYDQVLFLQINLAINVADIHNILFLHAKLNDLYHFITLCAISDPSQLFLHFLLYVKILIRNA